MAGHRARRTDTVLVVWDLAVSAEDRERFAGHVEAARDQVQVAPYRLYPVSTVRLARCGHTAAAGSGQVDEVDSPPAVAAGPH